VLDRPSTPAIACSRNQNGVMIKEPTRITEFSNTTKDLILTSNKSKVKLAGCYDPGISDHHLIYAVVKLRRQKSSPVIKEVTDFKNVNCELLRQDLNYAPWSICGIFDDIDDVAWAWESLYKGIWNDHLKTRKVKARTNGLKWMNSSIRKEMNRRYALLKRA